MIGNNVGKRSGYLLSFSRSGGLWAACSSVCAAQLAGACELDTLRPLVMRLADMEPAPWDCLHCGWCGVRIWQPERCMFHEDKCPPLCEPIWRHPDTVETDNK